MAKNSRVHEILDYVITGKKPKRFKKGKEKIKKKIVKVRRPQKIAKPAKKDKKNAFSLHLFGSKKKKKPKEEKKPAKIKEIKETKPQKKGGFFHVFKHEAKKQKKELKKIKQKANVEKEILDRQPASEEKPSAFVKIIDGKKTGAIRTEIDDVYEFILKRKSVRIDVTAKHFRMPEKNIEKLAKILEEHDLVAIDYPPFGKVVLEAK